MSKKQLPNTPTKDLVRKLRLMGESGGMLTRDRLRVVLESADRLEDLDERVAIMMETSEMPAIIEQTPFQEVTSHES